MIKFAKYIGIISTISLIAADKAPKSPSEIAPVSYTHLDVYKRQP